MNDVEERAEAVDVVQLTRERGGEIEAEAVDVHLRDPIPQAVHDQLQHARVHHVQRIAAARVVRVITAVLPQPVVGGVVDAAKAQRRAELIAFRGVVVDDVEQHFDTCGMQPAYHRLELADVAVNAVARLGREEPDRVVAPVVSLSALDEVPILNERMDRHQLDRGDTEALQVLDRRLARKPRVRAAQRLRNLRMGLCEAFHVQLVDDRLAPRRARRAIVAPTERGIDDFAARHSGRIVPAIE